MHAIDLSAQRLFQKEAASPFKTVSTILSIPGLACLICAAGNFADGSINTGFVFLGLASICGAISLWAEERQRRPQGDVRDLVNTEANRKLREETGRARYDYLRNNRALLLSKAAPVATGAGALLGLAGHTAIPFYAMRQLASRMRQRARRHAALSGSELRAKDTRPIVLYLRSFNDDRMLAEAGGAWSLEQIVVEAGSLLGPVVAIGRPGEGLPPLGAARDYVNDEEWQQHAHDWMEQAATIFLVVGETEGLAWEAARITRLAALSKCVLIIPPTASNEMRHRWEVYLKRLEEIGPELHMRLQEVDVEQAVVITFSPDLEPLVISADHRDAAAYQVALTYALGIICNRGSEIISRDGNTARHQTKENVVKLFSTLALTCVLLGIARLAVYGVWEYPNRWKHDLSEALQPNAYEQGVSRAFSESAFSERKAAKAGRRLDAMAANRPLAEDKHIPTSPAEKTPERDPQSHPGMNSTSDPEYHHGLEDARSDAAKPFIVGYGDGILSLGAVASPSEAEAYTREVVRKARNLAKTRYPDSPADETAYRRGYIQGALRRKPLN